MNALSPLPQAVFLLGPTASGKTAVAVALAAALPCEIVSVDSALIYRQMDIGTAKPDAAILQRAPHRLIDIRDPDQSYSAAQFRNDALNEMAQISEREKIPLLVGGTMLYFKALAEGLSDLPQADPPLRAGIDAKARQVGWAAMHAELARLDPLSAGRLKPTDAQRIQRALEVCLLTGAPLSAQQGCGKSVLPYRLTAIGLEPSDRTALHERIAARFDAMLSSGFLDEVRGLRQRFDLSPALPSMRCVGYRQVWQHLDGEFDFKTLREKGVAATRQLAKRQLTWLRGMQNVDSFDCLADDLANRVLNHLRGVLAL